MIALGRHIIAELYNCDLDKIDDVTFVENSMLAAAEKAGATVTTYKGNEISVKGGGGPTCLTRPMIREI